MKYFNKIMNNSFFLFIFVIILFISFTSAVRLPIVGGDEDNWGVILNEYLNSSLGENATFLNISQGNITLGQKITFSLEGVIDNIITDWIRITGGLNITKNAMIGENLSVLGILSMQNNSIKEIYSLNSPDGSAIAFGNNPLYSSFYGIDNAIIISTNQSLAEGIVTHALLDTNSNKVLAAWQSGKNDSGQYTRNSMGIFPDAGGNLNLSFLTNVEAMWNYYGITPLGDYYSASNKTALGVLYGVETQKLFLHDELNQGQLRVEGEANFILSTEDDDVGIFGGGQLWLRDERIEESGFSAGESFNLLTKSFEGGLLNPFSNIGTLNWAVLPSSNCYSGECAYSDGGGINNMEANVSTVGSNYCNLSFYITTVNYDPGDYVNVTINDVKVYSFLNGTDPTNQLIQSNFPANSINKSNVQINFIAKTNVGNEVAYIDNIIVVCNSTGESNINLTVFDGTIYFGKNKEYYIRYNDSTKVFDFVPNNVSFTSVTQQEVNITSSITLNGTTIEDWNNIISGNLSIGKKITFGYGEFIDNLIDGWIKITGELNISGNLTTIGAVGIGIGNPSTKLHVHYVGDSDVLRLEDDDGICNQNPESGSITTSCSSDKSLKENIQDAKEVLTELEKVPIKDYKIKASGDNTTGVIAQEINKTNPEMVHNINGKLFVEQPNPWKLLKAIQELNEKINILYEKSYSIPQRIAFNKEAMGTTTINADKIETEVIFESTYETIPIISVTPLNFIEGPYKIADKTNKGFKIKLQKYQNKDVKFDWYAFAQEFKKEINPKEDAFEIIEEIGEEIVIEINESEEDISIFKDDAFAPEINKIGENQTIVDEEIGEEIVIEINESEKILKEDLGILITGAVIGKKEGNGELVRLFILFKDLF